MAERRNKTTPWDKFASQAGKVDFTDSVEWQRIRREEEQRELEDNRRRMESAGSPNTRGRYISEQERRAREDERLRTQEQPDAQRFGSAVIDSAQGGVQRTLAGQLGLASANMGQEQRDVGYSVINPFARLVGDIGNNSIQKLREVSPWYDEAVGAVEDWATRTGGNLMDAAAANTKAVEDQTRNMNLDWIDQGVIDFAGSPSSAVSVFGGPAAAIGAADVQGQEYVNARRAGVSHADALSRANAMAGIEAGLSVIPGQRLLEKIPGVDKFVSDQIRGNLGKWATRTGAQAVAEGGQETVTTLAQMGVEAAIAQTSDDEALRDFAAGNLPKTTTEFFNQVRRSAVAGAVGGASFGQAEVQQSIMADAGKLASDMYLANAKRQQEMITGDAKPSTGDVVDDWLRSPFQEQDAPARNINVPNAEQLRADAERVAGTLPVRQPDLPADAEDFNRMPIPGQTGYAPYRATPEGAAATAEQATNARDIGAIARENERLAAAVTARQNAMQEGEGALQSEANAEAKRLREANAAQNKKFTDERRAARTAAVQQAMTLPQGERARFVADAIQQWDANNARPEPLTVAPPAKGTGRKAATPTAVRAPSEALRSAYKENFPDLDDAAIDAQIAQDQSKAGNLKARLGLAESPEGWSTADTTTKVTPDRVVEAIGKQIGNKNANIVAKMIGDGKVVIDTAERMPIGPQVRGAYIPGTGKIHLNADRMDAENIMGEVLSVLAHETKHGGDIGGENIQHTAVGDFIGVKANDDLVKKITAAANAGNPIAARALDRAAKGPGGSDEAVRRLEIPAYFIQAARDQRNQRGVVARISSDLVSAVRTAAKKVLPGDADINLNDVAYMSDRLLAASARAEEGFTPRSGKAVATIAGPSARGAERAEATGRAYTSKDGSRKFVFSDMDSRIKPLSSQRLLELKQGEGYSLEDILDHPELYENYPEARKLPVTLMSGDAPAERYAQYIPGDQPSVELGRRMLTGEHRNAPSVRAALLHEVQHWVQDQEGKSGNLHTETFVDRPAKEQDAIVQFEMAKEDNDNAVQAILDNDAILDAIPARWKSTVDGILFGDGTDFAKAKTLAEMADLDKLDPASAAMISSFEDSLENYRVAATNYNAANKAAYDRYRKNITEQEAFFTEENVNTPQERLPVNPEEGFAQRYGDTFVPENVDQLALASTEGADTAPNVNTRAGKAIQLAKAQGLYHSGLGKELYDRLQLSVGEAAVDAQRGLNAGANIDAGIKRLAKRTGQSVDEVRSMVESRMDSLAKLPSPEARERALAALSRQYPELRAVSQAYSDIDQLTKKLVAQMYQQNPNPTEKDIEFMEELLDNSFGYTTRMYAAYQGEAGSEYSRKLVNDYDAAKKKVAKNKNLNAKQQEAVKKVDDAIDYLIRADLTIPDATKIGKAKLDKIRYLYDTWIGNSEQDEQLAFEDARRDGMKEGPARIYARSVLERKLLEFAPKIDTAALQSRARDAVDTILGVSKNTGSVPQYLRTASADRGILQKRNELPKEIRSLLGEITDPRTRVSATLAKQGELAARNKFLLYMRENGRGKWVASPQDASDRRFTATLSGEGFGPLKGWKTTPQIESIINDQLGMFSTLSDALAQGFAGMDAQSAAWLRTGDEYLKKGAGAAKVASVILEGFGTLMNATGSLVMPVVNGVINPKYWGSGAMSSADLIKNEWFSNAGQLQENTQRAVRLGVVDSAKVNELRDTVQRRVRNEITGQGPVSKTGRALNWSKRVAIEAFAQSDVWPKIAALDDRIDMLTKYYKAEGVNKSKEDIEVEAATDIKDSNISSDRVPPAIKALEARGVTTFLPYFYNVPRSLTMSAAVGAKDFIDAFNSKTMEGRLIKGSAAIRRVGGTAAVTWTMVEGLKQLAAWINGDDEEKVEEMRKVMRPDARYGAPVYLGKDDSGAPLFFRLGRVDPYGPVNDMFRMLLDPTTTPDQAAEASVQYVKDLAFANRFSKVVIDTLSNTVGDGKFKDRQVRLERIAPETVSILKEAGRLMLPDKVGDVLTESGVSLIDTLLPGISDVADPANKRVAVESKEGGKMLGDTVIALGGKLDRANPISRAYEIQAKIKESRDRGRRLSLEYQGTGRIEAAIREARRVDEEVYDAMLEATELYEGMVNGLGYSQTEAMDVLKTAGLDAKDIAHVRSGRVPTNLKELKVGEMGRVFSEASLEQRSKVRDTMLSPEERKKARNERLEYLRKLREEEEASTSE